MTSRDRAVIAVLLVVLAVIAGGVALPAVAPVATPAPGASGATPTAAVYREGILGRPESVSPFGARTQADRDLVALVFSGLVRLGQDDAIEPDLADHWAVDPTGAVYTFTLRPGAVWQDGLPVTAEDVAFTFRTLRDPAYAGPGGASWREVSVEVLDSRTVRFTLATPLGGFLAAFTQPIAPAHLLAGIPVAQLPDHPFGQQPVGSGPFELVSLNATEAVLVPSVAAGAADGPSPAAMETPGTPAPSSSSDRIRPQLSRLEFHFFADASDLAAAYRAGQVDVASGLPPDVAASLGQLAGSHLLRYPRDTVTAVVFNLRPGRPELRDARLRTGLLAALDRDGMVAKVLDGLGTRADSLIPPQSWAFDPSKSPEVGYSLQGAAKSLQEAGWKKSAGHWIAPKAKKPYVLELISPDAASNPVAWATAEVVAEDWTAFGFTVNHVGLPGMEFVGRLRSGAFQAAVLDVAIGLDPDLYPLLASTQTLTGGGNVAGLQDPGLDTKLVAARKPGTDGARRAAYADLQAYLAARQYLLPLYARDVAVVTSDRLLGPTARQLADPADRFWDVLTWRLAGGR